MIEISRIPEAVKALFYKKGIDLNKALYVFKSDMARQEVFCDAYSVLTEDGIASLFVLEGLSEHKSAFSLGRKKYESTLTELDWNFVLFDEFSSLRVLELQSALRVEAVGKRPENTFVLFYASNHCLKAAYDFCEAVNSFLKSGKIPEKKRPGQEKCPRCHTPFPDPERPVCKKCQNKRSILQKLLPFFARYRFRIALVLLTVIFSGVLDVLAPFLSGKVFYDEVLSPGGSLFGRIAFLVGMVALANLFVAITNMVNSIIVAHVSATVTYDLKKTIFSSFERLSYAFFSSRHTGRLMTQINNDATTLYWFFCDGVTYFITNIIQILGIGILMLTIDARLTLMIFIPLPILLFAYRAVLRLFKKMHAENYTHHSKFNSILSDVLGGMRIVKAFSREATEIERFNRSSSRLADSGLEISLKKNTFFPLLNVTVKLTSYLIWGFGGFLVIRHALDSSSGISYGTLMLFISYLSMLYNPLSFFAEFFGDMAKSLNSLQRLFEIMETEPDVREKENAVRLNDVKGEISFRNVSFSYGPGKKTIDNVSFSVPAGKTLGIVGHTGAGKSTLTNLLTRLYDADSGIITIDGVDVRDLSFQTLRENIAIVSQETYLFRGTVMDNIRYAAPNATEEECIAAAKIAGAHDFIVSFPDGYDTLLGFDKKLLSGGEKQRISIARAILKNPKILILDEATAAMDTKTERKIQEALNEITRERTTIIIAHRLSTLRDADSLIVVEDGKVVEEGTHESLVEKDGVYHTLYKLQLEALKIIGIEE